MPYTTFLFSMVDTLKIYIDFFKEAAVGFKIQMVDTL